MIGRYKLSNIDSEVSIFLRIARLISGITLEDPRIEDLTQEVRGFIFSKIIVCSLHLYLDAYNYIFSIWVCLYSS